eukprot:9579298-Alexandrium_andersonii.AAC.1
MIPKGTNFKRGRLRAGRLLAGMFAASPKDPDGIVKVSRKGHYLIGTRGATWGPAIAVNKRWAHRIKKRIFNKYCVGVQIRACQTWSFFSAHMPHAWGLHLGEDVPWDT